MNDTRPEMAERYRQMLLARSGEERFVPARVRPGLGVRCGSVVSEQAREHRVVVFFAWVQNSIELLPVMSPTPNFDSFQPPKPNGSSGTGTPTLMPIMPALACRPIRRASAPFRV
jgi:hypothetical protein